MTNKAIWGLTLSLAALLSALESAGVRLSASPDLNANPTPTADPARWLILALTALVGATAGWILGRGLRPATWAATPT